MPIEVHCPNPVCARIHAVKNRYAGMRGKCPACGAWMYVPRAGQMPSVIVQRPEGLERAAASRHQEAATLPPVARHQENATLPPAAASPEMTVALQDDYRPAFADENDADLTLGADQPLPAKTTGKTKRREPPREEEAPVEVSAFDEEDEADEPKKPRRGVNWFVAVLLFLGVLAMGAVAASPYLEKPSLNATGDLFRDIGGQRLEGIGEEKGFYVTAISGGIAGLVFLVLIGSLVARGFGFVSLFLLYLVTVASAGLLFFVLVLHTTDMKNFSKLQAAIAKRKQTGVQGDAQPNPGMQLQTAVYGAAGACGLFVLGATFIHRRWWSRLLGFLLLGLIVSLPAAYIHRTDLGIADYFPADLERTLMF